MLSLGADSVDFAESETIPAAPHVLRGVQLQAAQWQTGLHKLRFGNCQNTKAGDVRL